MIIVNKSYTDTHTKRKRIEREKEKENAQIQVGISKGNREGHMHIHSIHIINAKICVQRIQAYTEITPTVSARVLTPHTRQTRVKGEFSEV